jgi:4-hydroxybenzoate polyprenyltransferase/phosphoserine phosphatase
VADSRTEEEVAAPPLYVDLDGTLVATDTLWESLLLLAKRYPLRFLRVPFLALRGKARLKAEVAADVCPDAALLPYREEVLEEIRAAKSSGRKVVLATAANERIGAEVARHLGVFDEVLASDGEVNLSGKRKAERIREHCDDGRFAYLGDARADRPVFDAADRPGLVTQSGGLARRLERACPNLTVTRLKGSALRGAVAACRPHQWVKNLLVAAPLLGAHGPFTRENVLGVAIAFLCFSLGASSIYVLNDLLDIEADRRHPRKRRRPVASGSLPVPAALLLSLGLAAAAIGGGLVLVRPQFVLVMAFYMVLSLSYSLFLKRQLLVDVIVLSAFYTIRILAGGVAVEIDVSTWLMGLSLFLFLSLAFVKRFGELRVHESTDNGRLPGRSYSVTDLDIIRVVGPVSGYLAVLVLALYMSSKEVVRFYRHPDLLWLACPALLYWITRIWFLANRGTIDDDPLDFAVRDRMSYVTALWVVAVLLLAT